MTVKNASQMPRVYFGMHMEPGVAEYSDPLAGTPYRIYINEATIKQMDPTFVGKPVYVDHVEEVNLDKLQTEADGYVIESFFNTVDGKHWAKFIVVSDRGHEAIRAGWKLSNAYMPKAFTGGGKCHNVEYLKEVTRGEYEHLAIVPNPRYEESIILTPDEFKAYNSEKAIELQKLANSKEEKVPMLKFFKKTKVENSTDLESTSVVLPSGKEMTITQLVNGYEDMEKEKKKNDEMAVEPQMANGDHSVMVGEEKMTVNELVAKHLEMKQSMDASDKDAKAREAAGDQMKPNAEEKPAPEEKEIAAKKEHSDDEKKEEKKEEVKKNSYFDLLKNAPDTVIRDQGEQELTADKVLRGKSRYGS